VSDAAEDRSTVAGVHKHSAPSTLERGASVARYLIVDQLGKGGMGVVYKAFDPELNRPLALKLINGRGAVGSLRDRLLREAQALARLSHPNVVAVHDVGTFGSNVFIAMEFVEGQTLTRWLKEKPRGLRQILDAFLAAGDGLSAAHRASLVHRDFKPDNVMVGHDGRVRVLDFGLARDATGEANASMPGSSGETEPSNQTSAEHSSSTPGEPPANAAGESCNRLSSSITWVGSVVGTPRFMAPEQHRGQVADERADQYSFCVSLYYSLYGQFPFDGKTAEEYAENVIAGHLKEPPREARIPRWVHKVLVRGLAVEPAARYPSMAALLEALRADPNAASWRRARVAGAVLLVAVGLLAWRENHRRQVRMCAGADQKLTGVWDEGRRTAVRAAFRRTGLPYAEAALTSVERIVDGYTKSWVSMHVEACEATRVRGEQSEELLDLRMECLGQRLQEVKAQVDVFASADGTVVEKAVQAASGLGGLALCADVAALRAPVRPPADPATRARVTEVRGEVARAKALGGAGRYADGGKVAQSAVDAAHTVGYEPLEAEALQRLAWLEDKAGDPKGAELTLKRAVLAAEAGHDRKNEAMAWAMLVFVGDDLARYEEAIEWAQHASALLKYGGDQETQADLLKNLGGVLRTQGKYEEALTSIRQALAIGEKAFGPDDQSLAPALNELGNVFNGQGKYEEAQASFRRALAIKEKALGPDHPDVATILSNLGVSLQHLGKYEEALETHRRALAIEEKALGPDHPNVALSLTEVGNVLRSQGKYEEALANQRRALAIGAKALGPDHPDVAEILTNLGDLLCVQGKYEQALVHLRRAVAIQEKALGPEHPDLANSLTDIGRAEVGLHQPVSALVVLERALALRQKSLDKPDDLADTRFVLARALWDAGRDRGRAHTLATQARDAYATRAEHKNELAEVNRWLEKHR
jgi:tetratricopeptide (TPR) repeat protein